MTTHNHLKLVQELQKLHMPNANVDHCGDYYAAHEQIGGDATLVMTLVEGSYLGLRVDVSDSLDGDTYITPVLDLVFNLANNADPYKVVNEFMTLVNKLEDTGVFTGEHFKT